MSEQMHHLRSIDFLQGTGESVLRRIARDLTPLALAEGSTLFEHGEEGDALFFIVTGTLNLMRDGRLLLVRGPGEVVGELALIDDAPRSASAVAAGATTLLCWSKDAFLAFLAEGGSAVAISRALVGKMRESIERRLEAARREQERTWAAQIQQAMLPELQPTDRHLEVAAHHRPADKIGGDFYDVIAFDDGATALMVADVEGHGLDAALIVAMIKSCVQTYSAIHRQPTQVMSALERVVRLPSSAARSRLVTVCYVLLEPGSRAFTYCSAGHHPPLHFDRATSDITAHRETDLLLGVPIPSRAGETGRFKAWRHTWNPGDLLVLYTDGITEAEDEDETQLGLGPLIETIRSAPDRSAATVRERILARVQDHSGGRPFDDDLTLIVARAR